MESLNLNMLANSLPTSNLANAEKDLTNNFKAAALSLTTLYRSSRRTSKRAYNAGYATACQDLLIMIQQGVSTGESTDTDGRGMTIGRIMDYIEARLEAIKSREEEEDEDEEKEKERERAKSDGNVGPSSTKGSGGATASKVPNLSTDTSGAVKSKELPCAAPPTPHTPSLFPSTQTHLSSPSPSPSSALRLSSTQHPQSLSLQKTSKTRLFALSNGKESSIVSAPSGAPFTFDAPSTAILSHASTPIDVPSLFPSPTANISETNVGSKRRHNVMMLDSTVPPVGSDVPAGAASSGNSATAGRRRTRSARGAALGSLQHHIQDQNQTHQTAEAMDIEEEGGRERKRVARR
ncbi:hypothetical protein AcW1_001950 [Taiwanofungus camphoratus]|nr:hypothetical protein AcW1_001950 [Antrodia cinnamomea]